MIEAYMKATEDVLRLAGQMFLRRMDDQLRWFAEDLHDFIYELDRNPRRDWRERFDAFLADQTARGRELTPESRKELIIYLEMWERNVYGGPPEPQRVLQTVVTRIEEPASASGKAGDVPQSSSPRKPTITELRRPKKYHLHEEGEFYQKLGEARRLLTEMARAVALFSQKLDGAAVGESIEVDADLDAIEDLIWRHNDALESARDIWLRADLKGNTYNRLAMMSDPTSVGLPRFIDDDQPRRAKAQWERISARLGERIAFLDDVIFAMEVIERIGTAASFALGAGIVINAGIQGGKVVLLKTVAKVVASAAIGNVIGEATGAALEAIGVEQETVEKVQNAVELISWLLILRRMKLLRPRPDVSPSPAQSTTTPTTTSSSPPRRPPKKSDRAISTHGGDPETNAAKARSQPHGPPRNKTYPEIEGELDKPRSKHHVFLQETIAQEMRATRDYVRITRRMHLSKVSGIKHAPNIIPDNIGVRYDGRIDVFEILSPKQTRAELEAKLQLAFSQLPEYLRGSFRVVDPKDAFK